MSFLDQLLPRVSDILYRAGITTAKTVLETPQCNICNLGISQCDIEKIYNAAAKQVLQSEFITGDQVAERGGRRWSVLSTGCPHLDRLMRGGVLTRGLTELSGQSGCGKTQLCLQLALTVQLPLSSGGLGAGAVFICTEDRFPSVRLNQLLKSCPAARKFPSIQFGNNIFIEHIADAADLLKYVEVRLPQMLKQRSIGLVVVDSVAAVFRADYTLADGLQRARDLRVFATQLHLLANTYNIAVVCVNQVSDVKKGEWSGTVPALGLAWANLVTSRLQMFRNYDVRQLRIVFSPGVPQQSCEYKITASGIEGIEQNCSL